jgi:hypothetical protein
MKKQRSDSLAAKVSAVAEHERGYAIPEGLESLTEREQLAWLQYCQARISWKDAELRILYRAVKLEAD